MTMPAAPAERTRVLVIGAGGHAGVCIESLFDDPSVEVVGAVSSDGRQVPTLGVPVLGTDHDLGLVAKDHGVDVVFVAIGDNVARETVTSRCDEHGFTSARSISRHAILSRSATVLAGAAIMPAAVVNASSRIGRGAIVNTNATVDHDCIVEDFVHVAPGAVLCGGITVGARTLVGAGARVLPNIRIGHHCTIGAGAVVVHDIPPGSVVMGVPGRVVRRS